VKPSHIFCRNPVGNGSAPVIRRSALETIGFPIPANRGGAAISMKACARARTSTAGCGWR
jgi:hypothetical protein